MADNRQPRDLLADEEPQRRDLLADTDPTLLERAGGAIGRVGEAATGAYRALTGTDQPFPMAGEFGERMPRPGDQPLSSMRTGFGFALTPREEQRVQIIQSNFPQAEFITDQSLAEIQGLEWPEGRQPRVMVRANPNEDFSFLNAPGFSGQDVRDLASGAALFAPAGRAAQGGSTIFWRGLRGAAASGATEAAAEEAARAFGAESGADPLTVGITALTAGASEPLIALGGPLRNLFGGGQRSAQETLTEGGAQALNRIEGRTPVQPARGGAQTVIEGGDEAAARRQLAGEFDVSLTRAQTARSPSDIREEAMIMRGVQGEPARNVLRPFGVEQTQQVEAAARRFGGEGFPTAQARQQVTREAGEAVSEQLQSSAAGLRQQINDAYDVARSYNAAFDAQAAQTLPQAADDWLRENNLILSENLTPAALQARSRLTALVDELGGEAGVDRVTLDRLETARREIMNSIDSASNNTDRRAAIRVREALDSWVDRAIDDALVEGDAGALQALRDARALRARYARTFSADRNRRRMSGQRQGDPAGELIQQIVEDDLTGTQVMNLLFGRSQIGAKRGTARAVERLVEQLGPDSPEVQSLRQAYVARLIQRLPTSEQPLAFNRTMANDWVDAMRGSGSEITRALFDRGERAQIMRFTRLLEELVPPDDATRTSGTAENLLRSSFSNLLDRIPVAGGTIRQMTTGEASGGVSAARRAISPPMAAPRGPVAQGARIAAPTIGRLAGSDLLGNEEVPR